MNLTDPRRSGPSDEDAAAPVELPHVLVTVAEDGTLTATVDGAPFPSPDASAWTRATFGPGWRELVKFIGGLPQRGCWCRTERVRRGGAGAGRRSSWP